MADQRPDVTTEAAEPERQAADVSAYGLTHVGLERRNNEDAYHVDEAAGFFVVCDGMGGHASGEIASRITVETMQHFVAKTIHEPNFRFPFSAADATSHETRVLDSAVRLANRAVYVEAQKEEAHRGMGTTVVAVLVGADGVGIAHVGDSRIYRWRQGVLEQVTEDHSLLNHYRRTRPMSDEEVRTFKGKNVIVRAVGLRDVVQPELAVLDALAGDVLLLCTDGLTDLVDDDRIEAIVGENAGCLDVCAQELIDAALAGGGKDNVTVLLVAVHGDLVGSLRTFGSDHEDTSPGFDVSGLDVTWDQETLPGVDLPPAGGESAESAAPQPVVGQEDHLAMHLDDTLEVDAPTPRGLPALRPEDVSAAVVARTTGPHLARPGLQGAAVRALPPLPPHEAPRPAAQVTPAAPVRIAEVERLAALDLIDATSAPSGDRRAEAEVDPLARTASFDSGLMTSAPAIVRVTGGDQGQVADRSTLAAAVAAPGASDPADALVAALAEAPTDAIVRPAWAVKTEPDDWTRQVPVQLQRAAPLSAEGSDPPPAAAARREALDPAVDAVLRRAAVRRTALPRGGRGPGQGNEVETPFARTTGAGGRLPGAPAGDLAAGGRHDPSATVGPGQERPSLRQSSPTARYNAPVDAEQRSAAARPSAGPVTPPGEDDDESWDAPTLRDLGVPIPASAPRSAPPLDSDDELP